MGERVTAALFLIWAYLSLAGGLGATERIEEAYDAECDRLYVPEWAHYCKLGYTPNRPEAFK